MNKQRIIDFETQKPNILKFLNKDSKILGFCHIDLDGIVSNIALSKALKNIERVDINYYDIDRVKQYNLDNYDAVIFSDICPYAILDYLSDYEHIIILDHHETALEHHNPSKNIFIYTDVCGSKVCHEFVKTIFGESRFSTEIDDLVNITNDYDLWILKDKRSNFFNWLFLKYRSDGFKNRFQNGDLKLLNSEKDYLMKKTDEIRSKVSSTELFDFETTNGCMFFNEGFINDIADAIFKIHKYDYIIILRDLIVSIRSVGDLDVGGMLKHLNIGGGHRHAAGFVSSDKENLKINLQNIEKYVYSNYEYARK